MKMIQLQIINDQDHTKTTLINSKGDRFTFNPLKHEGLDSFLSGCKLASYKAELREKIEGMRSNKLLN